MEERNGGMDRYKIRRSKIKITVYNNAHKKLLNSNEYDI